MKCASLLLIVPALLCASCSVSAGAEFDGLGTEMGNLFRTSDAKSRSISPENFTGKKGKAGMATEGTGKNAARNLGQGWKVSPSVRIEAGRIFTLADIKGPGCIQQIWMTPTGNWRKSILRFYWDDEKEPSIEVPLSDFFAVGHGKFAPVASLVTAEPYDAAKDIEFFAVPRVLEKSGTFGLRAGDFVVFGPGDAHRPSLHLDGPHVSRKAVVKVSVAYRDRHRAAAGR